MSDEPTPEEQPDMSELFLQQLSAGRAQGDQVEAAIRDNAEAVSAVMLQSSEGLLTLIGTCRELGMDYGDIAALITNMTYTGIERCKALEVLGGGT